ncbi:MAG: DUF5916 domain-containing protein [Candidatus Poribacteria bacterium]|nr:DUF5916 domain-containing protein [Candidatus Poribacteria bacterium]
MLLLFSIGVGVHAETEALQAEAYRTYESVEIDGELTESDWQNATPIRQFIQFEPDAGASLTEATEVRILYDERHIYFGFVCSEPDRSKIVANKMRRDAMMWDQDNVFVLLDTYNDRRSGFFFRVNPLGAREDVALMDSGDSRNENWNAVWDARAKINGDNWTTEIAIPFSQLRFKDEETLTWGLNLGRTIQKNQEEGTWAPVPAAYTFLARYRTTNLGTLTGLSGISQRRNIEFLPYLLPGVARTEEGTVGVLDFGADMKVSVTSNLTADLTVNTDFAQVEADREQANLTRFSLFFPEKRQFFLEGAGLLDFGIPRTSFNAPPPLLLFYSRRIGIEAGHAIPILAGGKVTGKVGGFGVGLLNVLTDKYAADATEDAEAVNVDRTNYSVLRIKRDLFTGSSLGMIAINKQGPEAHNRATGVDFIYRPTGEMNFRGLWARTFDPDGMQNDPVNTQERSANTNALYFGGNWQSSVARVNASYTDIGEDFNPEVGYVYRTGSRWFRGELRGTPYLHWYGLRRMWIGPELDIVLNSENQLETRTFIWSTWLELETNGWGGIRIYRNFENLIDDFEIREGITIPRGKYSYNNYSLMLNAEGKVFNGRFGFNVGDFYNGTRRGFDLRLDLRFGGRFSLEPRYEFNRVTLPQDGKPDKQVSFDTNVFGGRVVYSFSTDLFTKFYVQWNSDRNLVTTNFLVNYIYRPGSDFYFVFNQTYGTDSITSGLLDTTVVGKVTYWWNP